MKVLILGATGLVGRNALAQALARPAVTQVIAPTRKPLATKDKLMNPVAPRLELLLPEVASWEPDAAICATGTTIKKAGSKEAFRSVDHDPPLSFAQLAHQAGTQTFHSSRPWEHRSIRPFFTQGSKVNSSEMFARSASGQSP